MKKNRRAFTKLPTMELWYKIENLYGSLREIIRRERVKRENVIVPEVESDKEETS